MKKVGFFIAILYGISAQAAEQAWWQRFASLFSANPIERAHKKEIVPEEKPQETSYNELTAYTDDIGVNFEFKGQKYNVVYKQSGDDIKIYNTKGPKREATPIQIGTVSGITQAALKAIEDYNKAQKEGQEIAKEQEAYEKASYITRMGLYLKKKATEGYNAAYQYWYAK